jgi:TonB family protein
VPDSLGPLNDVVVVRVLVSQTGHPSVVSLLRRSKAGSALDEAVVAAVKQWTFSPARKRGEAVSCWFNVGVPINRAQ